MKIEAVNETSARFSNLSVGTGANWEATTSNDDVIMCSILWGISSWMLSVYG